MENPAASLFGTGPSYGMSSQEIMGWIEYGGGRKLMMKHLQKLVLIILVSLHMPMPAQPFGWFKKERNKSIRCKRYEVQNSRISY